MPSIKTTYELEADKPEDVVAALLEWIDDKVGSDPGFYAGNKTEWARAGGRNGALEEIEEFLKSLRIVPKTPQQGG